MTSGDAGDTQTNNAVDTFLRTLECISATSALTILSTELFRIGTLKGTLPDTVWVAVSAETGMSSSAMRLMAKDGRRVYPQDVNFDAAWPCKRVDFNVTTIGRLVELIHIRRGSLNADLFDADELEQHLLEEAATRAAALGMKKRERGADHAFSDTKRIVRF